ncbi:MAG TPA: hypothetical protein VM784_10340 [Actinomycetota bacterium]|nr:hypothetical protein [Actinomycetota bacterium]
MNAITHLLREAVLALDETIAVGSIENARRAVADADRRRRALAAVDDQAADPTLGIA